MGLFTRSINSSGKSEVPVWFMRQAGRYHEHYQNIKKDSDFVTMCKTPSLAHDVTMGPIEEFRFDAAILFSDILFPLEQLGMGLEYSPGPKLGFTLQEKSDLAKLREITPPELFYRFQGDALKLLRKSLDKSVTLLGFVGAPFTLYTYAVEGGHAGNLTNAKTGLYDGRHQGFLELLYPNLLAEMNLQAESNADAICIFDTAAGELSFDSFTEFIVPTIRRLCRDFKKNYPKKRIVYYSRNTHLHYLRAIECSDIDVLGVDWRIDLTEALKTLGKDYIIQGNLDPSYLYLPWEVLEQKLTTMWHKVEQSGVSPDRWICGLGHGVLQRTPEENVFKTVEYIHRNFIY